MARIDTADPEACWTWPGAMYSNGYGHVRGPGRGGGDLLVHIVVYEGLIGPVPAGLELDHGCRNKACCNPRHLEPTTRSVNQSRAMRLDQSKCRAGLHDWSPENLTLKNGRPTCRLCWNDRQREQRARRARRRAGA